MHNAMCMHIKYMVAVYALHWLFICMYMGFDGIICMHMGFDGIMCMYMTLHTGWQRCIMPCACISSTWTV